MFDPHADAQLVRPAVSADDALSVAVSSYNLSGKVEELGSNQDRNYLLTTSGQRFLLKFDNDAFSTRDLELQNEALLHLSSQDVSVPTPIRDASGSWITSATIGGKRVRARLLSFVEGDTLVKDGYLPPPIIAKMGSLAGKVVQALASLEDAALDRDLQWDMRNTMAVIEAYAPEIVDAEQRDAVLKAAQAAWPVVQDKADCLPVQAIHGDITDDNVVGPRDSLGRVVPEAVIDWGDLSTGWRVAEIAVTVSSILHHNRGRPLDALPAIRAFDEEAALSDGEMAALWPLVVLRGAVIVASAAHQLALEPENHYVRERMAHEWHIFDTATKIELEEAHAAIRTVCGRPNDPPPTPECLLAEGFEYEYIRLDAASPHLHRGAFLEGKKTEDRLASEVIARGKVPVFAYGEHRLTRTEGVDGKPPGAWLYLTLRLPHGTQIRAPFDGRANPTIDGVQLHDHAGEWRIRVRGIVKSGGDVKTHVKAGEALGDVGECISGLYLYPHYPFICLSILYKLTADDIVYVKWARAHGFSKPERDQHIRDVFVPTTTTAEELPAWRRLTWDPAFLFGLPPADWLPDVETERARRTAATSSAAEKYYELPPVFERGWREVLYDSTGKGYIDMVNNVAGIGHGHPAMADAIHAQLLALNTNNRFLYPSLAEYVERLRELAPDPRLSAVLLVNSGSEAVELALKLAHAHTRRRDIVALREGYHGWTEASDAVSTSAYDNPSALGSRPKHVHIADAVNSYRGHGDAQRCADNLENLLARLDEEGTQVGAFIAEPVFGNGGGVVYPDGYLASVYESVRKRGGVCIADEVQVGLGRLGHFTWGVQQQKVIPDILAVAKALGNAYPLGAVYTTPEISASLQREGMFFSSAAGANASAVAGLSVLNVMRDEKLQTNAASVGDYLGAKLKALMERHKIIGCIHGLGLYQGIELVRSREGKEPATRETAWVCERMLAYGVIVQPASERQNVLKVKPPLTLTREHADVFVKALDCVLGELEARFKS